MDADPAVWETILWTVICGLKAGTIVVFATLIRNRDDDRAVASRPAALKSDAPAAAPAL